MLWTAVLEVQVHTTGEFFDALKQAELIPVIFYLRKSSFLFTVRAKDIMTPPKPVWAGAKSSSSSVCTSLAVSRRAF